jgi:hypothetical protein
MLLGQPAFQSRTYTTLCSSPAHRGCGNDFRKTTFIQAISAEIVHTGSRFLSPRPSRSPDLVLLQTAFLFVSRVPALGRAEARFFMQLS